MGWGFWEASRTYPAKRDPNTPPHPHPPVKVLSNSECFVTYIEPVIQKVIFKQFPKSRLISNRRNFGLPAPKSMRFLSKDRKSKDLSFLLQKLFTSDFSLLTERAWKFVL